jgi:hypothetical protein
MTGRTILGCISRADFHEPPTSLCCFVKRTDSNRRRAPASRAFRAKSIHVEVFQHHRSVLFIYSFRFCACLCVQFKHRGRVSQVCAAPSPTFRAMALLCWYAERRAAVKGAPFFDAAKRTLEGEDPLCENSAGRNGDRPPGALADRDFGCLPIIW